MMNYFNHLVICLCLLVAPVWGDDEDAKFPGPRPESIEDLPDRIDQALYISGGHHIKEPLPISVVRFSPNGRILMTGTCCPFCPANHLQLWDSQSLIPIGLNMYQNKCKRVLDASFSLDGLLIVESTSDEKIRIWNTMTQQMLMEPLHLKDYTATEVVFNEKADKVMARRGAEVLIWNLKTQSTEGQPHLFEHPIRRSTEVTCGKMSKDGKWVCLGFEDGSFVIWDMEKRIKLSDPIYYDWPEPDSDDKQRGNNMPTATPTVTMVKLSTDKTRVLVCYSNNTAVVWHLFCCDILNYRGEIVKLYRGLPVAAPVEHKSQPINMALSPDATKYVASFSDLTIDFWEIRPTWYGERKKRSEKQLEKMLQEEYDKQEEYREQSVLEFTISRQNVAQSMGGCLDFSPDSAKFASYIIYPSGKNIVDVWKAIYKKQDDKRGSEFPDIIEDEQREEE